MGKINVKFEYNENGFVVIMENMSTVAIKISDSLGVKNQDIKKYLKVFVGEEITQGTCLAQKKSFLKGKTEVFSPIDGVVEEFDLEEGQVILRIEDIGERVVDSEDKKEIRRVKVKSQNSDGVEIESLFSFGKGEGEGYFVGDNFDQDKITFDMEGLILLVSNLPSLETMYKASCIGIEAIISLSNNLSEAEILEKELSNKIKTALCLIPSKYSLKKLDKKVLLVDGSNGLLMVKS